MSNQRRSRYTVTFTDETQQVVLDYDSHSIREWLEPRTGKTVKTIRKGDYRKAIAKREAFREGGFRIIPVMLEAAKAELDINWPVSIHLSKHFAHHSGQDGYQRLDRDRSHIGFRHTVMVKAYLKPERASHVLWHELTHCMQDERDSGGTWAGYLKANAYEHSFPYSRRPCELEAERVACEHEGIMLCA